MEDARIAGIPLIPDQDDIDENLWADWSPIHLEECEYE